MKTLSNDWTVSSPKILANLDIFKTPSNLHFLHYIPVEKIHPPFPDWPWAKAGEKYASMELKIERMPIIAHPSVDDLWEIENNHNISRDSGYPLHRRFAANILLTSIARKSRRAAGNILIVPNAIEKMWFDDQFNTSKWDIKVFVDPTLEPNELRATYWKTLFNDGKPTVVDGGIQFSPEGVSCIQKQDGLPYDYRSYFSRGFR